MSYVFTPDPGHFENPGYAGLAKSYVAKKQDDDTYTLAVGTTRATFGDSRKMFTGNVTENNPINVGFMINLGGTEVLVTGTLKYVTSKNLEGLQGGRRSRRSRIRSRSRTRRNRRARTRTRK